MGRNYAFVRTVGRRLPSEVERWAVCDLTDVRGAAKAEHRLFKSTFLQSLCAPDLIVDLKERRGQRPLLFSQTPTDFIRCYGSTINFDTTLIIKSVAYVNFYL